MKGTGFGNSVNPGQERERGSHLIGLLRLVLTRTGRSTLSLFIVARNALGLLLRGEWREFNFRLQVFLGCVDLKACGVGELNLPEERSYAYADSGGLHLEAVLKGLHISARDAIVDFGCGKGGALFTFSKYPFREITGCELSPELAAIAQRNLRVMKIQNVNLVVADAARFTDLDGYNYFYFFNPFPCNVMREVARNISDSLVRRPRKATVIYCNPECHATLIAESPFVKIREQTHWGLTYSIYTNETTPSQHQCLRGAQEAVESRG